MGKLLLGLAILAVAACATIDHEAKVAQAATPVARGRVYYEWRCQQCHALYSPKGRTADEWSYYVRKYGPRARLTTEQRVLVLEYLGRNAAPG